MTAPAAGTAAPSGTSGAAAGDGQSGGQVLSEAEMASILQGAQDQAKAAQEEAEKWKAMSRKNEDTAKSHAAELEALRKAQKPPETETERVTALQTQIEQMQQQMRATELRNSRLEIATAAGLTPADADFLQGETPEEIAEFAQRLAARIGAAAGEGDGGAGAAGMPPLGQGAGRPLGGTGGQQTSTDPLRNYLTDRRR